MVASVLFAGGQKAFSSCLSKLEELEDDLKILPFHLQIEKYLPFQLPMKEPVSSPVA
jgi:hypothetical protein